MNFDNLSDDLEKAYKELDDHRLKVFNSVERQLEKKRLYDERIAELRRIGLDGSNKEEREADLKQKIKTEAHTLEACNGDLRHKKYDHESALLKVEHLRAQIRVLENLDRIKGR